MNYQNNENRQQSNNFANNDPYFKDNVNDTATDGSHNQSTRDDPFAASDVYWQSQQGQNNAPYDPYAQYYGKSQRSNNFFDRMSISNEPYKNPSNRRGGFLTILKALLFVLLFFAVQFAVIMAVEIPVAAEIMMSGITDDNEMNTLLMEKVAPYTNYLSALSGFVTIVIILIIFVFKRQNPFKELSFNKTKISTVVLCLLLGIALNFSCNVLFMILPQSWLESYSQASESLDQGSLFSYVLGGVIIAPLVEEIVFRGLVMKRFQSCMPSILAAVLAAVVFGICHGDLVWAIYAGSLGIVIGVMFARFESIIPCICIHFAFNGVSAVLRVITELPAIKNMNESQELIFNGAYAIVNFAMVAVSVALITVLMTSPNFLVKKTQQEDVAFNE